MTAIEQWRPIDDTRYMVSDQGRVRNSRGLVLRQQRDKWGYPVVLLRGWGTGKWKRFWVHQLVMRAFVGEPAGLVVRHLDGNPSHNWLSNLTYGTLRENQRDSVAHGTHANASKTHCKWGHAFTPENTYIHRNRRACRACNRRRAAQSKPRPQGSPTMLHAQERESA